MKISGEIFAANLLTLAAKSNVDLIFNPEAPSCGVYGAKLVKPSLTFAAPQTYASDFLGGL